MQRKCVQCYLMRSKLVQCPGGHSICTNFRLSNYSREDFIKIVLPHSASLYASKRALFAAFIVNYCANLLVLVSRIDESVPLFYLLLKFPCTIIFTFSPMYAYQDLSSIRDTRVCRYARVTKQASMVSLKYPMTSLKDTHVYDKL